MANTGIKNGISEIYNVTDEARYNNPNNSDYGSVDVDTISGVARRYSCPS